jgi:hypothetical protein
VVSEEASQVGDSGGKGGEGLGELVVWKVCTRGRGCLNRIGRRGGRKMKMGRLTDNWI